METKPVGLRWFSDRTEVVLPIVLRYRRKEVLLWPFLRYLRMIGGRNSGRTGWVVDTNHMFGVSTEPLPKAPPFDADKPHPGLRNSFSIQADALVTFSLKFAATRTSPNKSPTAVPLLL